jgi:hypothetical protein
MIRTFGEFTNDNVGTISLAFFSNGECLLCFSLSIHHHMCKQGRLRSFSSLVLSMFYRPTDEQDRSFLTQQSESVCKDVKLFSGKLKILGHITRLGSCNTPFKLFAKGVCYGLCAYTQIISRDLLHSILPSVSILSYPLFSFSLLQLFVFSYSFVPFVFSGLFECRPCVCSSERVQVTSRHRLCSHETNKASPSRGITGSTIMRGEGT